MASICYDCKLGYGHQLIWCPGCGRQMHQVKQVDWDKLKANNWRMESDPGLMEYFINGDPVSAKDSYEALVAAVARRYPLLSEKFELGRYVPTRGDIRFDKSEHNRTIKLVCKNGDLHVYVQRPVLRYRLSGTDLEVLPVAPEAQQGEFDERRL